MTKIGNYPPYRKGYGEQQAECHRLHSERSITENTDVKSLEVNSTQWGTQENPKENQNILISLVFQ